VVTKELLDGLVMLEYARWGYLAATTHNRLQPACWACFAWHMLANPVNAKPSR
jgi:hypothetical protein